MAKEPDLFVLRSMFPLSFVNFMRKIKHWWSISYVLRNYNSLNKKLSMSYVKDCVDKITKLVVWRISGYFVHRNSTSPFQPQQFTFSFLRSKILDILIWRKFWSQFSWGSERLSSSSQNSNAVITTVRLNCVKPLIITWRP